MPSDGYDGILELPEEANSLEEFLLELDDPRRKHEVISALDGEGRLYELNSEVEFSELDSLTIGIGKRLYEYLHREPSEEAPKMRP